MSIQSDVEMLSIQAMERYARRNHITGEEAIERLRYNKVNNQISFHTEEGVKCLKLLRRECYE